LSAGGGRSRFQGMKTAALLSCTVAGVLAFAAPSAHALFKVVGPDGKVTYTDRPPSSTEGRVEAVNRDGGRVSETALPYALRQVASRFPVTLYTASDCGDSCSLARAFLARRGIPYDERTATTAEERRAWPRIVGGVEVPTLTVGAEALRGFSPSGWDETLTIAGYPRDSTLPSGYQPTTAPLIAPKPAAPPKPAPATAPADNGSNPSGIRF
jgi:hypothetical protein